MDPTAPSAPPDVTTAFFATARSRLASKDPGLRFLGRTEAASAALADVAARTRSSVWNMQRFMTFSALRDGRALTEEALGRGVTMRMVVRPFTLAICPIASSEDPDLRLGPVEEPLMIMDSRHVVIGDRRISRELGVSERTVSNEVREMGRRLGTTNRAHTIARICGGRL